MRRFLTNFAWVIFLVLSFILGGVLLSMWFNGFFAIAATVILGVVVLVIVTIIKFRRHLIEILLVILIIITSMTFLFTTGVFSGAIDWTMKSLNIKEDFKIGGNLDVSKNAHVGGDAVIDGNAKVGQNVTVNNDVVVGHDVTIGNNANVGNDVNVGHDVNVKNNVNVDKDVNVGGSVNTNGSDNCNNKPTTNPSNNNDGKGGGTPETQNVSVTGVSLSPTSLNMNVGEQYSLSASVAPSNATNKALNWNSNNTNIATVSDNGRITALSAGTVTITVRSVDGGFTAACTVNVAQLNVAVTGVNISPKSLSMTIGQQYSLSAVVSPTNASNKNVTWQSNNDSVASVSNGVVTARNTGTATITVRTTEGGYTDSCVITVSQGNVAVTGVSLSQTSLSLDKGQQSSLTAYVQPANATNKDVTWQTSNAGVASVSNGVVVANGSGTATITVRTTDGGYTATCVVTVRETQSTISATIKFGDHISGATDIFASVVLSDGSKVPNIQANVPFEIVKVNSTVYHVKMTIPEGSHGVIAVSVSGTGITYAENSMNY